LPVSSHIVGAVSQLYHSLPKSVFLRATDCLHLITALHEEFEEICTFDRHQQAAVQALGLTVVTI
jgi:predicted nucleic acid-binding protein